MFRGKKISVVVPAYNEDKLIVQTLESIPTFVDRIFVVDDKSEDFTSEIIKQFSIMNSKIEPIFHKKNIGVGGAVVSGFKKAIDEKMDIVSIMAGDNQMDPAYLDNLIEPIIDEKADFTKGNRLKKGYRKNMGKFRLLGNFLLTFITKIASGYWKISDPQNGFVAISIVALKKLNINNLYNGYAFENDLMIRANASKLKMLNVDIPARYGEEVSNIKYGSFIFKTSFFLMKSFFWRIWKKYLARN